MSVYLKSLKTNYRYDKLPAASYQSQICAILLRYMLSSGDLLVNSSFCFLFFLSSTRFRIINYNFYLCKYIKLMLLYVNDLWIDDRKCYIYNYFMLYIGSLSLKFICAGLFLYIGFFSSLFLSLSFSSLPFSVLPFLLVSV